MFVIFFVEMASITFDIITTISNLNVNSRANLINLETILKYIGILYKSYNHKGVAISIKSSDKRIIIKYL